MSYSNNLIFKITETYKFASVQCNLPGDMARQVRDVMEQIPNNHKPDDEVKKIRPHVTVFYGLSNNDLKPLQEQLQGFGTVGFTIKGKPDLFENDTFKVLHFPVESDCLKALHRHISNLTGKEPPTFKEYKPHVTVAYLKPDSPHDVQVPFDSLDGNLDTVHFHNTDGNPSAISLV